VPSENVGPAEDSVFALPALDDPPSTEVGVILMGLAAEHLLAGLALASMADDPAAVTLLADQARHAGAASLPLDRLVAAGIARWQAARAPLLAASGGRQSASARLAWAQSYHTVGQADLGPLGPASAVYLAACLLRHAEIDRYCGAIRGPAIVPEQE
jgi:Family of unknown function (DUF6187)